MIKSLLILFSVFGLVRHNFHVSITNAELNPKSGSLEMSMKLFTDDLEAAVEASYDEKPGLGTAKENPRADSLVMRYIRQNFKISSGKLPLKWIYVGHELENGITFVYLEVPAFPQVKQLTIRNSVFFDRFDDQSNIVNVKIGGMLKSAFMKKDEPQKQLVFD